MIRNRSLIGKMCMQLFGSQTVVHRAGVVGAMCDNHGVANKGDLWGCFVLRELGGIVRFCMSVLLWSDISVLSTDPGMCLLLLLVYWHSAGM